MRHSGLDIIGDVPWGTHFCQFYQTPRDLTEILVDYFRQGLLANEYCMWITSEPLSSEDAKVALRRALPDLDERIERGQMEFLEYDRWYKVDGIFDSDRVLLGWEQRERWAIERGFDGLRLSGNTFWLEKDDWKGFADYEEAVDRVIGSHRMLALCTYSLEKCGAFEIMDVVRNHQFALFKQDGKWELMQSLRYRETERALRSSEAEARQHKEMLAVTLASIGDGVIATDGRGRVTFLNAEAERLTGWKSEQAQDQPLQTIFRVVSEQSRQPLENPMASILEMAKAPSSGYHKLLVARDGREIPIDDTRAPIQRSDGATQGVVVVFRDYSRQRKAQEALKESENRVRRKLESVLSPEGGIGQLELADIIDAPAIQSLMESFYELTRIPMAIIDLKGKVLVGVGWQDICTKFHRAHPETCKHCIESDTELSAGVAPGAFKLYRCKNHMWDIASPILVGGQHVGNLFAGQFFFDYEKLDYDQFRSQARQYGFDERQYLAALDAVPRLSRQTVDTAMAFFQKLADMLSRLSHSNIKLARSVAERDSLTASLQAAKISAEHAKAAAEAANKAKDQFIAILSHELRTPLTPAMAAVSILQGDARLPADVREDLNMVSRNIALEVQLIADLLDISRVISGKLHLQKGTVDIATAIREAAAIVSGDLDAKGQSLTIETPGSPYLTTGDAARLQQVFWNLIRNAVKFSPEGSAINIHAKISGDQSGDGATTHGRSIVVEIADRGIGIPAETLPRIFSAFEQDPDARRFGGLGLGLSICKAVVEMHGGVISAHSEGPGRGTTITVSLPITQSANVAAPINAGMPGDGRRAVGAKQQLRILLVEDHADTAKIVRRLLVAQGHDVILAGTVKDGLAAIETLPIDVMISDLGLPDGSGLELMRQVLARGKRTPAIALSGYGTPSDIAQSKAAGFAEHLVKPLHGVEMINAAILRLGISESPVHCPAR